MKQVYRFLLFIFVLLFLSVPTSAEPEDVFANGISCSQEQKEELIEDFQLRPLVAEPSKNVFRYFDVNQDGTVAFVYDARQREGDDIVVVYSSDGVFQYGFRMNYAGYLGVVWQGEELYLFTGTFSFLVNDQKECVEIKKCTEDNGWSPYPAPKTKIVGDTIYQATEKVSTDNYSVLTKTDSSGESVFFRAEEQATYKAIWKNVFWALFVITVSIAVFFYAFLKIQKNISKRSEPIKSKTGQSKDGSPQSGDA